MKLFEVMRGDVMIAEGVVFVGGAVVVHALLRRDRDSLTRFPRLADVTHYYRGCVIQFLEVMRPLPVLQTVDAAE